MRAFLEAKRRQAIAERAPLYVEGLHDAQLDALQDPSREKAYLCGRRAGKTHLLGVELYQTAENNPGETSLYIALTKGTARRTMGNAMLRLKRDGLIEGGLTELDGQLFWKHPNGHRIWLAGCKHVTEAEKFRGDFYCLVVIDEGASFAPGLLDYLIDDVLHWALVDRKAPLIVAGTPGALPKGLFYEVTTGDGRRKKWPTHSWTMRENPSIKDPDKELDRLMAARGETIDSASIQREFFHQWIKDESALIYPCVPERNHFHEFDDSKRWYYVLSIDLGWNDDTTFTVSASQRGLPYVYFLESYGRPEMTLAHQAAEILRLQQRYKFNRIVADTGGLGKAIVENWSAQYGIFAEAADKRKKAVNIRALADALRRGTAKVHPFKCEQLVSEWSVLPWDETRNDHHPQYADHCSDGALYGYNAHPITERWEETAPEPGSPEEQNKLMNDYREELVKKQRENARKRNAELNKRMRRKHGRPLVL